MRAPEQVLADLGRWLEPRWHRAVLTPDEDWPYRISLRAPKGAALEAGFHAAVEWTHRWRDWSRKHRVELITAGRRVHGTAQNLPTHLILPDVDTAVRLLGGDWPDRIRTARARGSVLSAHFPHAAPAPLLREVTGLNPVDFELLLMAADWFSRNDATGLTPRQVPIEGLDSKWLNTTRRLVQALSSKADLGLIDRPHTAHFTYLDPQHLEIGGRRYDSATAGDAVSPAYLPETVVITENKDTTLFFPQLERGIAVQGVGKSGPAVIPSLPWVAACRNVVYWGDLDADGFEIVNLYRSRGLDVRTILMDMATLNEYARFGVNVDSKGKSVRRHQKPLPLLTDGEREVYELLTDPNHDGPGRVEQERIPLLEAHALALSRVHAG